MSAKDGGPAFPRLTNDAFSPEFTGMSLRDYFIAHAPAEPQLWFAPAMPPKPRLPDKYAMLNDDDRRAFENDVDPDEDPTASDSYRSFCHAYVAARHAIDAWQNDLVKQRFIQWPVAWADEMLKARNT